MPSLDFKGKQFVYTHHLTVPFRELVVDAKKSLPAKGKPSMDDNLIIHGDNLHALKALLPRYAGKVKCIYIDPPYNTGNEGWCYNDNVRSPLMQEWVKHGNPVEREDMERHDKWLSMMWPRLQLLRELLAANGVIFVSIDDNEQASLKALMDEIFGEENFVAGFVWKKKAGGGDDSGHVAIEHEYVLCYARLAENLDLGSIKHESSAMTAKYNRSENGQRYYLERLDKTSLTYSSSMDFEIGCPDGTKVKPPQPNPKKPTTIWRWSKSKVEQERIR